MFYRLTSINFPDHKHINTYFRKVKEKKQRYQRSCKGHPKKVNMRMNGKKLRSIKGSSYISYKCYKIY